MTGRGTIRYSMGIDMGASNVRVGLLDAGGALIGRRKADIREMKSDSSATLRFIRAEAEALVADARLRPRDIGFIGFGIPGTVDDSGRRVSFAPNLGWRDVSVGESFACFPDAALTLVQDARAAAFAEYLLGAGREAPVIVCITLGTGIGAGIIMNGKVFHGAFNTSGEIGHLIVQEDGLACGCGQSGCMEVYCSGTAIMNAARRAAAGPGEEVSSAEEVFRRARDGDSAASGIISRAAHYLGIGIVNVVNLLSPNAVILSGGMCEQEDLLIRPVREFVLSHAYGLSVRTPAFRLVKAMLGEDSPMIGAGMIYKGT
jgi:glucokinase